MDPNWTDTAAEIRRLLLAYTGTLPRDAVDAVEHYIAHDEYEMALEGLCLELMKLKDFSREDRESCRVLAKRLGLDQESVFDPEFWQKLALERSAPSRA